jgi:hypothetical protein
MNYPDNSKCIELAIEKGIWPFPSAGKSICIFTSNSSILPSFQHKLIHPLPYSKSTQNCAASTAVMCTEEGGTFSRRGKLAEIKQKRGKSIKEGNGEYLVLEKGTGMGILLLLLCTIGEWNGPVPFQWALNGTE